MRSWSDKDLETAVAVSTSISAVLRLLGLSTSPGNFRVFHREVRRLGLYTGHFKGKAHGLSHAPKKNSEFFCFGSEYPNRRLKARMVEQSLVENCCSLCGVGVLWQGLSLTLQLDHINGDSEDNRLENLRLLCPNCHSQTSTFCGKKLSKRYNTPPNTCELCGTVVLRRSRRCKVCVLKDRPSKIEWPPATELAMEVTRTSYTAVAERLGVSDNAIKKHLLKVLGCAPKKYKCRGPESNG